MLKKYLPGFLLLMIGVTANAQNSITYSVSFPALKEHIYHVQMEVDGLQKDSLELILPNWMPGYYQLMHYYNDVKNFRATATNNKSLVVKRSGSSGWTINTRGSRKIRIEYDILTTKKFVANSYVDEEHAYLIPGNSFMYVKNGLDIKPTVKIVMPADWEIATGLRERKKCL